VFAQLPQATRQAIMARLAVVPLSPVLGAPRSVVPRVQHGRAAAAPAAMGATNTAIKPFSYKAARRVQLALGVCSTIAPQLLTQYPNLGVACAKLQAANPGK
jgi:hypothetical protein